MSGEWVALLGAIIRSGPFCSGSILGGLGGAAGIGRGISCTPTAAGLSTGAELDREADGGPDVIGGTGVAVGEAAAGDAALRMAVPQRRQN